MEEKTINIMDLLMIAWRRIWVIILAAVVFAVAAFSYCEFLVTPSYSATASILVTNGAITTTQDEKTSNKVAATDISASLYLSHTVVDILKTPNLYKQVADALGEDYKFQSLQGNTSVNRRSDESLFVDITYSSTDSKEAMRVVNKITEIACDYIPTKFSESVKADVVATAVKSVMTYPRTAMTTAVAAVVGAVIAYIVLFIIESMNRAIKGEEDFTNNFDVPLLGSVPDFENIESGGYRKKGKKSSYGGYGSAN